ncbi:MAG: tRNA pseudouridine(13) synthase TruD [Deltaproteobacteria bacterium]|nr:tRNA pseudouridine(13) synthase TruD [Deltaproteobacteria bacterium]
MKGLEPVLPYLTPGLPGVGGVLRASPEDFRVEELPAYEPSGSGEHTWVRFEKTAMTTPFALQAMARELGVNVRDVGVAGMKDRHAVTVQHATFPRVEPSRVEGLAIPGLRVLAVSRHGNKLKTGHLRGNRFELRVTGLEVGPEEALLRAEAVASVLRARGAPNYYGEQRFGRDGDNAPRGLAMLQGTEPWPRDGKMRRLFVSAAQSALFNVYLSARVDQGLHDRHVLGDLALRVATRGRPWVVEPSEAEVLFGTGEASPTGPMFGPAMPWPPEGTPARAREEEVLARRGLTAEVFGRAGDLGEGTRRPTRLVVEGLLVSVDGAGLKLAFTLGPGGYATVVAREFQKGSPERLQPAAPGGIQPTASEA